MIPNYYSSKVLVSWPVVGDFFLVMKCVIGRKEFLEMDRTSPSGNPTSLSTFIIDFWELSIDRY